MGNLLNKDWMNISGDDSDDTTIETKNSKVVFADFDPRSPSSGIQRYVLLNIKSSPVYVVCCLSVFERK
jgi:hypothetical protein